MNSGKGLSLCLKSLFRDSYQIHELANQLKQQSQALVEISMNAAVASGNTGHQSKVFIEIAKQIGVISALLNDAIHQVHEYTGNMSRETMECIVLSEEKTKFSDVMKHVSGTSNQVNIQAVIHRHETRVNRGVQAVYGFLAYLRPQTERIRKLLIRVWSLVVSLRISAGISGPNEEAFFLSIAESLESMIEKASEDFKKIWGIVNMLEYSLLIFAEESEPYAV